MCVGKEKEGEGGRRERERLMRGSQEEKSGREGQRERTSTELEGGKERKCA